MQDLKFKVIEYIRFKGPSLPVQVSKQINSNILFAGAVLSELVANQKIKISHAKIGGSPVYYFPGQESRLNVLYSHLHERERRVYDLLKEKKVLKDRELEPWQRVALRDLKDFAYPLKVNEEIFWKWYLIQDNEVHDLIKNYFAKEVQVLQQPTQLIKEKIEEVQPVKQELLQPKVIIEEQPRVIVQKEIKPEPKLKIHEGKEELKKKIKKPSNIYDNIKYYFGNKNISIVEEKLVKRNKEYEFILEVPSEIGKVKFFCVLKDKKKINEADLSLAHNKAQLKKLPLMFLSNGELIKSSKSYLENNYLIFEKI